MSVEVCAENNTILVVDDTPTNLQVLFELLSAQGYRVAIAKNGESALERLEISQPNLILLDVMMPGMDGFEVCRQLKANPDTQAIPVIFMSALSDSVDKVKGLKLGAVDYITKPIQLEEALARIQVHLQLRQTTQALEQTVETLKKTQLSLIQAEKMSALGQLVSGVAHEINNPVNFIYGNVSHAKDYVQELLSLLALYQKHYPTPVAEIQQQAKNLDIAFLQSDLVKLLDSMELGTNRIRDLVISLRNFSRHDEAACKAVNLHDGIDSTLLILQHRLKSSVGTPPQIIRDYGQIPSVECYPSQLNQVFMNLLSNAIDAFESSAIATPTITIRTTSISPDWIEISIADNAGGIPESIQSKLFDPFFTTKPIGKGTGLGLSISHHIVTEKHRGKIQCHSTVGQETEFTVQIPLTLKHEFVASTPQHQQS